MAKYLLEDLKKEASMINWTLLSDTYSNLDTSMQYRCPNGHEVELSYRLWRDGHICPICTATTYQSTKNKIAPKTNVKKRVIALDVATHNTGWAIFDDDKLIKFGVYSVNQSTEVERISSIKLWLINMIYIWKPDQAIIEDIQLQREKNNEYETPDNVSTYKILAHLQGVLQNTFFELKIPFETVYVGVWRKACEIKGRYRTDQKRNAQLQVKKLYNIDVTDDEADAICIGRYYLKKTIPKIIRWE